MRLYGKKNVRRLVDKRTKRKQEIRDAIIWEIDGEICRVKIQGSNTMVVAHFPRNQKKVPLWLRVGNAVKVVHKDGIRGYIEVIGQGRCIPTPISGGSFPGVGDLSDGIMSGLVVIATDPVSPSVQISDGTHRINEVIYSVGDVAGGYIIMDDPAPMVMGVLPYVMAGQIFYELNAGPASGYFRYDILVIGIDGDIDLIEGAAVTLDPVMPDVPANHVLIAFILRVGGESTITMGRINQVYTTPYPIELTMPAGLSLAWSAIINNPEINFTVSIKDQYGALVSSADGWIMKLTKLIGTGEVWSADSGYNSSEVQQDLVSVSSYTFKYRRDQTESPEISPYLQATLESDRSNIYGFEWVILLDSGGDPI